MILSELKISIFKNNNGIHTPLLIQKCSIKCDKCSIEFFRLYNAVLKSRKKYGLDLCRKCGVQEFNNYKKINNIPKKPNPLKGKTYEEYYGKELGKIKKKK